MNKITPRRPYLDFKSLGAEVLRLDTYRTLNPWWQRVWKPKYNTHFLAMTKDAIYDVCPKKTSECDNLFGGKDV